MRTILCLYNVSCILSDATEDEDDYLDKAWGLQSNSRLSCQAIINDEDLIVEIPRYTINHASERH